MATPDSIAGFLLRGVNRAVRDFDLITDGDRIAVGVSGGKDSRTLLDLLLRGVNIPGAYSVVALHVDGSGVGLPDLKPRLEPWFKELGTEYAITPISVSEEEVLPMDCFRCAWNRRKAMFHAAGELGCNKIAFGHHADDAAVTTLMSLMIKGQIETLAPRLNYFGNRFTLIRPLIYLSEVEIKRYVRASGWEIPTEPACAVGTTSRRAKTEAFLSSFPRRERQQIRANLWRATGAHMSQDGTGDEA
jgi:tRNA 2-thiocytidine biosynthesis protein TtcA